jgi:type II secretory pathway pseudopilin PulG
MRLGEVTGRRREQGFTYIGVLISIAVIGCLLAAVGQAARTTAQREREKELLFIGHAYRSAIARYFRENHRYPQALDELVQFELAGPQPAHYLRRLYSDPMTGAADWALVPALGGGIMGVASSSKLAPIKKAGFDAVDLGFEDAETYGDWIFLFDPRLRRAPGQQGAPGIGTVP